MKLFRISQDNLLWLLSCFTFLSFLIIILLDYLEYLPDFWHPIYFFYVALIVNTTFFALKIHTIHEDKRETALLSYIILYSAVLLIIVQMMNSLYEISIIDKLKLYFIGISICLGFLSMLSFSKKLKNQDYIDFLDKKRYLLLAIAALFFLIFALLYNLGSYDFREDEFQVIGAATGYQHNNNFYKWDWIENKSGENNTECVLYDESCYYDRAWPHTVLVAYSFQLFGTSEWSARIVSAFFGLLFFLLTFFFIFYFFEDKNLALVITGISMIYPTYLLLFRYTRMYALLLPLFIILVYLTYNSIIKNNKLISLKEDNFPLFKVINFNYVYLILALILLYITYLIHVNSLILLISVFIFLLFLTITTRQSKYFLLSFIGIMAAVFLYIIYLKSDYLSQYLDLISFFNIPHYEYILALSQWPFGINLGVIFFFIGLFATFLNFKYRNYKIIFIYFIVIISTIFFVYFTNRYYSFNYISHISIFSIMLITFGYFSFIKIINNKSIRLIFIIFIIISPIYAFYLNYSEIYNDKNEYGEFSKAYALVINASQENDVIFGQYLRDYYFKNSGKNFTYINMLDNKKYDPPTFQKDLESANSGWVVWESRKSYHLDPEIITFVKSKFKQYSGKGLDDTNVEVYYFNESMK